MLWDLFKFSAFSGMTSSPSLFEHNVSVSSPLRCSEHSVRGPCKYFSCRRGACIRLCCTALAPCFGILTHWFASLHGCASRHSRGDNLHRTASRANAPCKKIRCLFFHTLQTSERPALHSSQANTIR